MSSITRPPLNSVLRVYTYMLNMYIYIYIYIYIYVIRGYRPEATEDRLESNFYTHQHNSIMPECLTSQRWPNIRLSVVPRGFATERSKWSIILIVSTMLINRIRLWLGLSWSTSRCVIRYLIIFFITEERCKWVMSHEDL